MSLTEITLENLDEAFEYKPWNNDQILVGSDVRAALKQAAKILLDTVPRSPLRTRALNALADVRMLCNAAITHEGVMVNANAAAAAPTPAAAPAPATVPASAPTPNKKK